MTEFVLSLTLAVSVLGVSAGLLAAEWNRVRCASLTFEATHAWLVGARRGIDPRVRITETRDHVVGRGSCGLAVELVELPKIETMP